MSLRTDYDEAIQTARMHGWTLGEVPGTLPAKIAAARVARLARERGQAVKAPSYGSGEYEIMVKRGQRLTLKSDPHRRVENFWTLLPGYVRAVEVCEAKYGAPHAVVSAEVADAFGMRGLPNVTIKD